MEIAIKILLLLAGLMNFIPVAGVLGPGRLRALYGVPMEEPNLIILMRHRALLFGLVGAFMMVAAFCPDLQVLAIVAGLVSMLGFVVLARATGGANAQLRKVVWVDIVASAGLIIALVLHLAGERAG